MQPLSLSYEQLKQRLPPPSKLAGVPIPLTTPAAVLVPLFHAASGELRVWLLRKSAALRQHGGQVALPGGKPDAVDGSLLDTALREAHEEIALPPDAVRVVGQLDRLPTWTGYMVTPFVGLVDRSFAPVPDQSEVARVFTAPLSLFSDEGEPRSVSVGAFHHVVPSYLVEGELVWGATAKILRQLTRRLTER